MTREEAIEPFGMLCANWPFLRIGDDELGFEIWYQALHRYSVEEIRIGFQRAIEELKNTPTVAEIKEFVETAYRSKRREDQEFNINQLMKDAVKCPKCNDRGCVIVVYPMTYGEPFKSNRGLTNNYEQVRACDCEAARMNYPSLLKDAPPMSRQKLFMLFGGESEENVDLEMKKYKEVVYNPGGKRQVYIRYEKVG